jgi:3-oxoadipate enol-lactonase
MSFDGRRLKLASRAVLAVVTAGATFLGHAASAEGPLPPPVRAVATVNGAQAAYEIQGEGHPLVLIHAGIMDLRMWDGQIAQFAQHYKVIRLNLRGFGGGDLPADKFSYVDDLHSFLSQLGIHKTYLLGLSMGSMVAIDYTTTYPEQVDGLILASAPLIGSKEVDPAEQQRIGEQFKAVFDAYRQGDMEAAVRNALALPFFNPAHPSPEVRRRMEEMIRTNLAHWIESQPLVTWPEKPAIERVASIQAPTLVMVGDRDVKSMLAAADGLTARIKGAKKIVIAGSGHHVNMEAPADFDRHVMEFLAGL